MILTLKRWSLLIISEKGTKFEILFGSYFSVYPSQLSKRHKKVYKRENSFKCMQIRYLLAKDLGELLKLRGRWDNHDGKPTTEGLGAQGTLSRCVRVKNVIHIMESQSGRRASNLGIHNELNTEQLYGPASLTQDCSWNLPVNMP